MPSTNIHNKEEISQNRDQWNYISTLIAWDIHL